MEVTDSTAANLAANLGLRTAYISSTSYMLLD